MDRPPPVSASPQQRAAIAAAVSLAASASPDAAEAATRRFFTAFAQALQSSASSSPPSGVSLRQVIFSVRRGVSQAEVWGIEFWPAPGGAVVGRVYTNGESTRLRSPSLRLEAASYKDLLDVAARRTSPAVALARGRVSFSGNIRVMRDLLPVMLQAGETMRADLPDNRALQETSETNGTSNLATPIGVNAAHWMPNDASSVCPLCNRPWKLMLRRHHCRRCGTLVCRHCSSRDNSPDRVRCCFRCLGGTPVPWSSAHGGSFASSSNSSFSPSSSSFAPSNSSSPRRTAVSFQMPTGSVSTDGSSTCREALYEDSRVIGDSPEGLLMSQISANLAAELNENISANPPSEREQCLWNRILAAERANTSTGGPLLRFCQFMLFLLKHALCAVLGLIALASWQPLDGHGDGTSAAQDIVGTWPSLARRVFISVYAWLFTLVVSSSTFMAIAINIFSSIWLAQAFAVTSASHAALSHAEDAGEQVCSTWIRRTPFSMFAGAAEALSIVIPTASQFEALITRIPTCTGVVTLFMSGMFSAKESMLSCIVGLHPWWTLTCIVPAITFIVASRRAPLRRLISIYLTAVVPIVLYRSCKFIHKCFGMSDARADELIYNKVDELMAPFLTKRFASLGGLFVKMGQWLSNVAYGVPILWQEHLKSLQDNTPADSEAHVRALLFVEFGQAVEEIFSEFEFEPLASASIAQVHRATMRSTGQVVAVKLQHDSVEPMMLSDIVAFKRIMRFVCWMGGSHWEEVHKACESWMREMVHELDFRKEVANLREVRQGLAEAGVNVVVPEEFVDWVKKRAYIMTFCPGFRFADRDKLALHAVDRQALAKRALHAIGCQLLEIGVFNSDPHAGNLLCQVREHSALPVLLDFGNCVRLSEAQRLAYCKLLVGVSEPSVAKTRRALDSIGLITSQSNAFPERDLEFMMFLFRDTGSSANQKKGMEEFRKLRKDQRKKDSAAIGGSTSREKKDAKKQAERYATKMPDEMVLFWRMLVLVRGLMGQLDAGLPMMKIFEGHARRALIRAACSVGERARTALPAPSDELASAIQAAPRNVVRTILGRHASKRAGLGIQVCVFRGQECLLDECAGVLGAVDPRPMCRDTLVPLADLSRIFVLLILLTEVRAKRAAYSDAAVEGENPGGSFATLGDVLAHRALPPGDARNSLIASFAANLNSSEPMRAQMRAAIRACGKLSDQSDAYYMPIGTGYVAAEAIERATTNTFFDLVRQLPGMDKYGLHELSIGVVPDDSAVATLSSSFMSDLRALQESASVDGNTSDIGGSQTHERVRNSGHPVPAENSSTDFSTAVSTSSIFSSPLSSEVQGSSNTTNGAGVQNDTLASNMNILRPLAFSVMDAAGGLLIDMGILGAVGSNATASDGFDFCPDLAGYASARALCAVMAAVAPAAQQARKLGREAAQYSSSGVPSELKGLLTLAGRAWDERGFEVLEAGAQDGSLRQVVGLTASNGFLSAAWQWGTAGGDGTDQDIITAVVLTNELSLAALPAIVIVEMCEALKIQPPSGLA